MSTTRPTATQSSLPLKEWVRRIGEDDMPIFAHTARQIAAASKGLETPVAELAHLILQDSVMTARVLRLANSAYYNPTARPVNTISRAIVYLGFDVVRSIALTIAIVDPLMKGLQQEHLIQEMARSFHAAVQAKSIAQSRGIGNIEEIFIAALLYRLGHMAFWCFPNNYDKPLDQAYSRWDHPEQAEQDVLGFPLRQLTAALNHEWHLSELLSLALSSQQTDKTLDLTQAYQLVLAVEEGWGSIKTKNTIEVIAQRISLSREDTLTMIQQGAREAVQVAREYGIESAGRRIPLPPHPDLAVSGPPQTQKPSGPDVQLQLSILRELTTMLHEKVDLNAILSTIMEGIFRALAMERTIIAFVSPDYRQLKAKYTLGDNNNKLRTQFDFPVSETGQDFFSFVLRQKDSVWLNNKTRTQLEPLISPEIRQCLGVLEFFVMPIRVAGKGKGIIYADCKLSGRTLHNEEFQTFTHFAEYANIAFELFTKQR